MRRYVVAASGASACALAIAALGPSPHLLAQAGNTYPDPNVGLAKHIFGEVSPLIPMQSAEAVHMGLIWKKDSDQPKLLYHARFPEYVPNDIADPAVTDSVINAPRGTNGRNLMDNGANNFNISLRDVLHPAFRSGTDPTADSFQRLTYGGYTLRQGLSQSVPTRIVANRTMERQLIFDIFHPSAFNGGGKFHAAQLTEGDFAMNRAAFQERYPSAIPLPNDWVLVVGGFDQDNTVPPDLDRAAKGRAGQTQSDTAFTASRVNIVVPEIYDPKSDRNIALENARMAFPLYPQLEVVQTGPGKEDWKVCTFNGEDNYGDERIPGGARFGVGGGTPEFAKGTTWCLDVLGAVKDPNRNLPAKNHWTLLDTAQEVRPYCCPTASLIELNEDGETVSHKWFMISGEDSAGDPTGTVEVIDFTDPLPRWRNVGTILQPLATTKAVLLPDGKVLIGHGVNRGGPCTIDGRPCTFDEREGHFFQVFDPADVDRGSGNISVMRLGKTSVSRGLHGTATLLPDARVFFAGENREALVRNNDPFYPLAASWAQDGVLQQGDPDQGVPIGQLFSPPYLFTSAGSLAARPVVRQSPREIDYRGHFDIEVAGSANAIASVALLRSDHNTHSLTTGDRYVKLAFDVKGNASDGKLRVRAPKLPGQAVPGVYILYVLDRSGVPSIGRQMRIMPETRGSTTAFR